MTAPEQGLRLLTAECPPTGDDIDQSTIPQRSGVTYTRTTVLVPSDRQLLLIPNTIPMPLNSTIAAVLFGPTKATENNNNSTSTNADASISVAAHVSAVVTGDSLSTISSDNRWLEKIISVAAESGSFVALSGADVAQVRQAQCRLADDRGDEQPNNLISAEWMESPAVFEVVSPSTDNVDDAATTATPIISFHSEDDGHDDDDQESEAYSDALPNNSGRGAQNPQPQPQLQQQRQRQKQGSLAAGSKEGASSTRKRPLEDSSAGDVEKPKKPRNSFFYFRREYHKQKNANGGRTKAKNISGLAAQMWKEMTEEQKEPYKQFAALDTMRYKQENKIYKESIRRDKKKPKVADRLSDTSEAYSEKQSAATRDFASAGLSMVSPPNATPASMSAGLGDSAAATFDIASFIPGVPVEIPADIVHTPSIFNEPMIISAGPPNVATSSEYPAQAAMASADFGNHQALSAVSTAASFAAASSSPLMYPYASSSPSLSQPHMQLYPHPGAYNHGQLGVLLTANNHALQQQQQQQQQPHQQQPWQDMSSFIPTINGLAQPGDDLSNTALIAAFNHVSTPQMEPQPHPHPHPHLQHNHHHHQLMAGAMLNTQFPGLPGYPVFETAASTPYPLNRHRANTTPNSMVGGLSTIPEIEVVDASNTITLPAYSISRHN